MKKLLLIPACFLFTATAFSQTTVNEQTSTPQTIEQLQKTSPDEYEAVLNYAKTHGSAIMAFPQEKGAKITNTIDLETAKLVDPYKMEKTIGNANQYFRIEGTDQMLMIKSLYVLQMEMHANN